MTRRKLERFAELDSFSNSFYNPDHMKGKWHSEYFKNNNPITLELGCGRGEYTIGLAQVYPERNFIGIDLKGARIWRGAKTALEAGMKNVAFVRSHIELISNYFSRNEVDEIWITFPDPQPQLSRERKRLIHPRFIEFYRQFLKTGGVIHLKTDNDGIFAYGLEIIAAEKYDLIESTNDVYGSEEIKPELQIQTTYEKKYLSLNKNINYLKFSI